MPNTLESFSIPECADWNRRFEKANICNNKSEIMNLLSEANKLYLDEYFIYSTISSFNIGNSKFSNKEELIVALKKCKSIKNIYLQSNYIVIDIKDIKVKIATLSDIIPEVAIDKISNQNTSIRKDSFSCEYLSQLINFPNSIVTGYIYGISDKSKKIHTWLEFKNHHNQQFVIDYDDNTVYNKDGYYYLKHAELLNKKSSDEMKGKSSVSKSDTSEISNEFIDIEIDMGDER